MRRLMIAGLALMLAACGSDNPLAPIDFVAWSAAQARWKKANVEHYKYTSTLSCFCPFEYSQPITVEYLGQLMIDARYANGTKVPDAYAKTRLPIDSLFAEIVAQRDDWVERIDVTYDKTFGYPTLISYNSKPGIADAGSTRTILSFEPLSPLTCPSCDRSVHAPDP